MKNKQKAKTRTSLCGVMILLCAVIAVQVLAQEHAKPSAKGWEHCALTDTIGQTPKGELAKGINNLGRDGWELVSVGNIVESGTTTKIVFYFKRPL